MVPTSKTPMQRLPSNVSQLEPGEEFNFGCHPGVPCFTECCRKLELALTPYDVLRLRQKLQLGSADFLEQYVVADKGEQDAFPHLYLAMSEDERGSCPFVTESGCTIYEARPGACRTYPLGRASFLSDDGTRQAFHVVMCESHCKGFEEQTVFTAGTWSNDQELGTYNDLNDEVMTLLLHDKIKQGLRPSHEECNTYILALYNLDEFRNLLNGKGARSVHEGMDDTALLRYAVGWLKKELFG